MIMIPPAEYYFSVLEEFKGRHPTELVRELVSIANEIPEYRTLFTVEVAKQLDPKLIPLIHYLLDDSRKIIPEYFDKGLSYLRAVGLVVVIAVSEEDHITLSPAGRRVCLELTKITVRTQPTRNEILLNMLNSIIVSEFANYMEDLREFVILEFKHIPEKNQVYLERMINGSVKTSRLNLDENKPMNAMWSMLFQDVQQYLRHN